MLVNNHGIAAGGALYATDEFNSPCAQNNKMVQQYGNHYSGYNLLSIYAAFCLDARHGMFIYGPLILSGALSLFLTSAVIKIKGFNVNAPSEDMEVVVNLHQYYRANNQPYQISHVPSANGWTIVPETMSELWQQRSRWHVGLFDSLMNNKKILFNYRYYTLGFFSYPFQVFGEFLGPLVEFVGYFVLIILFAFR